MSRPFVSGWSRERAQLGLANFYGSGRRLYSGRPFGDDNRPLPKAFSLSGLLDKGLDQGPVGLCYANMGAAVGKLTMEADIRAGLIEGVSFWPARLLIAHQCRHLDGDDNGGDVGGTIVNSFAAMGPKPQGVGLLDETLLPYQPSISAVRQAGTSAQLADADKHHLTDIAAQPFSPDGYARAIFNGSPVGIGIDWCDWDQGLIDHYGRTTGTGWVLGGHAVTTIGWCQDWDGQTWWEILNSHGHIYPAPPADVQARIAGYKYTGFSFWMREDILDDRINRRGGESFIAGGVSGFAARPALLNGLLGGWTGF